MKPALRALPLLLLVAFVQLACARMSAYDRELYEDLYRRPSEPQPRIPGEIAPVRSHASKVPPMRLTASDGTGLALRSLIVRGLIDDPLSSTELHLTFENPNDQTLDGQFEILLPSGAEVSRFALMVGGAWIESEVVEREQARQIYRDHMHTKRDPAMLERERGRRFSGRIFPIGPRERKQIILRYAISHDQPGASYRIPLAGLPRVDELDVEVVVRRPGAEPQVLEHHVEQQAPDADFVVQLEGPANVGLALADQALLRVVPIPRSSASTSSTGAVAADRPKGLSVLLDTSASMAAGSETSVAVVESLIAALEQAGLGELPLELVAFDQVQTRLYAGTVAGADARVLEQLRMRPWLGASDLGAALDAIGPEFDRVICVSDGEPTAGATTRFEISAAIERASDRGVVRIDAIMLDGEANHDQLDALVDSSWLESGVVFDVGRAPPSAWVDELLAAGSGSITLAIAGAKQVWPREVEGLRPGQALLVHASFAKAAPKRVEVEFGGALARRESIELRAGDESLAARAIAVLRVGALIDAIESEASAVNQAQAKREIVELSTRHRILNDSTAMLALDSDQAYANYGIAHGDKLPVGTNLTRDFTASVDMVPTATRDAAGISLAGTTGAESRYVVDGFNLQERLGSRRARQQAHADAKVEGSRRSGRPPAPIRAAVESIEASLDEAMLRCARHAAASDVVVVDRFDLELGFAPSGQLIHVVAAPNMSSNLHDCALLQLHELAGAGYAEADESEPANVVVRRYRVSATPGRRDDAPEDWHIRGVAAFARELQREPGSGTSGWAKFIEEDLADGLVDEALDVAWIWHHARPDDLLPYVSLGRALAAAGQDDDAARAYGSLIDLHPSRAETRRFAGALLESLEHERELELALDSYRKARALQPDHPTGYQVLAFALARHGDLQEAVEVLVDALGRTYAAGRFGDAVELMRADLASLAAAAIIADPSLRPAILSALVDTMVLPSAEVRDHFTLTWESDASSLDLLQTGIGDGLAEGWGADFSAQVTTGYGPQGLEWAADFDEPIAVSVHANDLGPEAIALGSVRRMRLEADGRLAFETRPFVIWPEQDTAELGTFEKPR